MNQPARSEMTTQEKVAYINEHGKDAFARLPRTPDSDKQPETRSEMTTKQKSDYVKEYGIKNFLNLPQ